MGDLISKKVCVVCLKEFYPKRKNTIACSGCWIDARKITQKLWQERKRQRNLEFTESQKSELKTDDCSKCNHLSSRSHKEVCGHEVFNSFEDQGRIIFCRKESKEWCPVTKYGYYKPIKEF